MLNLLHLIQYEAVVAQRKVQKLDSILSPGNDHVGIFNSSILQLVACLPMHAVDEDVNKIIA